MKNNLILAKVIDVVEGTIEFFPIDEDELDMFLDAAEKEPNSNPMTIRAGFLSRPGLELLEDVMNREPVENKYLIAAFTKTGAILRIFLN